MNYTFLLAICSRKKKRKKPNLHSKQDQTPLSHCKQNSRPRLIMFKLLVKGWARVGWEPGHCLGWAHISSGEAVWCRSPCQRVFGKGNPLGVCKFNIISVSCVATAEGKAIAPKAGGILHENRADPLPRRGQGLRDPRLAFLRLEGARLLDGELLNGREEIRKSLQGVQGIL